MVISLLAANLKAAGNFNYILRNIKYNIYIYPMH